ncbi:TetR/AcrR family transcriptional regulator [Microbulbifer sp. OS29]|uniref:TetR/AcrR family transcriptional regulator n=1 Tax=Microbulbifer okhotskensis TaxID=2926617 RepID=A0A9X2J6Q0_9GAMM|nr:TetR/AcrR family transcriptional regulator [Microbulbifer okhotskensis]MCO1336882.1 TetR/AcrR family transcriptional regulator [Microbulbifer okhotskensis]
MGNTQESEVATRLIEAARECFLSDEYHRVTTRQIAAKAGVAVSMIRYYFGSKDGLYEDMIRQTLLPLIDAVEQLSLDGDWEFSDFFDLYYSTMQKNPRFPALILKIMALNQGPGKNVIRQLLERGRQRGARRLQEIQGKEFLFKNSEYDLIRIAFVSLAMLPMLAKPVFEEQMGQVMGPEFLKQLSDFNGCLLKTALQSM